MPTLTQYRTATQRLLGTTANQALYSDANLNAYINTARGQVAIEGQCIRALPPISGAISSIAVTSGGTGWQGNAQVVISAPDLASGQPPTPLGAQATATATASSAVTAVTVLSGGAGYFAPLVTFSGTGQGTVAVATISGVNQTVQGQEVYPFSAVSPMVAVPGSGIQAVFMVNSVSVLWGNSRYTLEHCGWSKFQALARNYSPGYQDVPAIWAQFGQGNAGSLYVQPVPNTAYAWEWDVCCTPIDLTSDNDVDAIPFPWSDCVPYYAAYLAFSQSQRFADADRMTQEFERFMKRARTMSQPRGVNNWYGRPSL